MFYWVLKTIVLGPVLRALFRPWVLGGQHVPATGGAIFASNHLSFSDSVFLPLMVDRRVTFLAKSDYFTGRGIKGRLTAGFFKGVGQLPVDRSGGGAGEAAVRTGLRVLRRGELLGIYPEGTRSPDGRLYRGKTGVARLALEGKVPVLPVVMVGTAQVQPIGRTIPRIRRVGMIIGRPLDFSRYEGMQGDRFVLRSITDEIMYELMRLSGQEYVDIYASVMKERLAAARRSKTPPPHPTSSSESASAAVPGGRRPPAQPRHDPDAVPEGAAPAPVQTSRTPPAGAADDASADAAETRDGECDADHKRNPGD
ncbi:MAG: lysophospholipid acyltransferase family protein [Actinomycetes bacterium]